MPFNRLPARRRGPLRERRVSRAGSGWSLRPRSGAQFSRTFFIDFGLETDLDSIYIVSHVLTLTPLFLTFLARESNPKM